MKMILIIYILVVIGILLPVFALIYYAFKSLVDGSAGNTGNAVVEAKARGTFDPTGTALSTTDDKQPIRGWQRLVSTALLTLKFLLLIFILGILYYSFKEEIDSNLKKNIDVYCFIFLECC
jgi:ABC-type Fe3+ transport system permease subunit